MSNIENNLKKFIKHVEILENERQNTEKSTENVKYYMPEHLTIYEYEFREIKENARLYKKDKEITYGLLKENHKKNRFHDIIAFDETRVKLKPDEYCTDYINANYIKDINGHEIYVAAQGPLQHTIYDFWMMLVQQNITVVVMVCQLVEKGVIKCNKYWPTEDKKKLIVNERLTITLVKETDYTSLGYIHREFTATVTPSGEGGAPPSEHTVHQLHVNNWYDGSVPSDSTNLLDVVERTHELCCPRTESPLLVHCSAGCGRTGCVLLTEYVYSQLRVGKIPSNFSLYDIIVEMRRQRPCIVQTLPQYIFVHQLIAQMFRRHLQLVDAHTYVNSQVTADTETVDAGSKEQPSSPRTSVVYEDVASSPPHVKYEEDRTTMVAGDCVTNVNNAKLRSTRDNGPTSLPSRRAGLADNPLVSDARATCSLDRQLGGKSIFAIENGIRKFYYNGFDIGFPNVLPKPKGPIIPSPFRINR